MTTATLRFLRTLKVTELRALLSRIGAPATGNKGDLAGRLAGELGRARIRWRRGGGEMAAQGGRARVLSVDMGVRNLAFCVCEVRRDGCGREGDVDVGSKGHGSEAELPIPPVSDGSAILDALDAVSANSPVKLHLTAWRRISVPLHADDSTAGAGAATAMPAGPSTPAQAFGPANLSRSAYELVAGTLLPQRPSAILIERQRFRSGGAAGVLEWTVRVNSLEGMIWAVLRTAGAAAAPEEFPDASEVLPSAVARFWLGEDVDGKVKKRDKVRLVARWLAADAGNAKDHDLPVKLSFADEAGPTRDAFLGKVDRNGRNGRTKATAKSEGKSIESPKLDDVTKLDDLADCLLQAAAWVTWERNRVAMAELVGKAEEMQRLVLDKYSGKEASSPRKKSSSPKKKKDRRLKRDSNAGDKV